MKWQNWSALDTREKATDYTDCNEYLGYIGNVFCEIRFGIAEDGSLEYISAHSLLRQEVRGHYTMIVSMAVMDHHPLQKEKGVEGFNGGSTGGDTTSHMIMSVHYQKTKL